MTYQVYHIEKEYLVIIEDEIGSLLSPNDWYIERVNEMMPYQLKRYDELTKHSWKKKVLAHVPLYNAKVIEGLPLLPEPTSQSYCKVEMNISTLFTIFVSGFNLGANEGPFPNNGAYDVFHNTIEGKQLSKDDNSSYQIKDKIKIRSIPTIFTFEREYDKDGQKLWLGDYHLKYEDILK